MRLTRPVRVRPPWRSSESWSLRVSKVDSIHWRMPPSEPKRGCSSFAVGAQEAGRRGRDVLLELGAGEAFVADHDLARFEYTFEQLGSDESLGRVGRGELEADREPVGGAEQVEAEAPEPAAVRAAVAVAADARPARSVARSRVTRRTAPVSSRAAATGRRTTATAAPAA